MVTQAPATAFACFQLATLAQKKRYLGTAPQSQAFMCGVGCAVRFGAS